jgi:hypothetical protein
VTATLRQVRDGIKLALEGVSGLDNVYGYVTLAPTPPCAVVGWPNRLDADIFLNPQGSWSADIPVQLLVGLGDGKAADGRLADLVAAVGQGSAIAALRDDDTLGGLDGVTSAIAGVDEFNVLSFSDGGIVYLGCTINLSVWVG